MLHHKIHIYKTKHFSNSLIAISCPIDDEVLILYTLNGLPTDYAAFKTSIQTRSSPLAIEERHLLLSCEELHLANAQQSVIDYIATMLLTSKDNPLNSSSKNNKGRGRGLDGYNNNPLGSLIHVIPIMFAYCISHYIIDF